MCWSAEGIPLTAGQRTGSKPIQWAESVAADMPGSAGRAQQLQAEQRRRLRPRRHRAAVRPPAAHRARRAGGRQPAGSRASPPPAGSRWATSTPGCRSRTSCAPIRSCSATCGGADRLRAAGAAVAAHRRRRGDAQRHRRPADPGPGPDGRATSIRRPGRSSAPTRAASPISRISLARCATCAMRSTAPCSAGCRRRMRRRGR